MENIECTWELTRQLYIRQYIQVQRDDTTFEKQ